MDNKSKVYAITILGFGMMLGLIATIFSKLYKDSSKVPEAKIMSKNSHKKTRRSLKLKKTSDPKKVEDVHDSKTPHLLKSKDSESTDEEEFYDAPSTLETEEPLTELPQELQQNETLRNFVSTIDDLNAKLPEDQKYAHTLLEERKLEFGDCSEYLWRLARSYRNLATFEEQKGSTKKEKTYILQAFDYATKALEINDRSSMIHKWYAILCGKRGDYLSINERIQCGHKFKEHIDIAVQLNPTDFGLHYLLGRFSFEVAQLPWIMRVAAKTLFGEVPMATLEEALASFLESEKLRPWKDNRVFISRCYFKLNQKQEGKLWLLKAHEMPVTSVDDELAAKIIQDLSKKYSVDLSR